MTEETGELTWGDVIRQVAPAVSIALDHACGKPAFDIKPILKFIAKRIKKMRVIMFQDRFIEKIRDGSKRHTIRKTARCIPGQRLSLRRWKGKPYRSKHEVIADTKCLDVRKVRIGHGEFHNGLSVDGIEVQDRGALARGDGFLCTIEMLKWFEQYHGLPFEGWLIEWEPLEEKVS